MVMIPMVQRNKLCHEKNPPILSIESWLVNRDPEIMAYEIIPI